MQTLCTPTETITKRCDGKVGHSDSIPRSNLSGETAMMPLDSGPGVRAVLQVVQP